MVAAALALCAIIAQPVEAGPYWPQLPTDAEISQAAQAFVSNISNRSIYDWKTFKYNDPQEGDALSANGVGIAYRVPNPDYDPGNADQPDLECGVGTLWYNDGWLFVGGSRLMCFSSTDTLDALAQRFMAGNYQVGWMGGGPPTTNQAPIVVLTYTPSNPTPEDTIHFTANASDPDGDALTYVWYLNDVKQDATMPEVNWSNPTEGTHTLLVVVSDGKGGTAQDSVTFTVGGGAGGPPCSIRYFTLNPQSSIAGPIVDPGQYMVWTAQVIRSPNPPTTGLQWKSTGPYEFKAGHRYVVTMNDNTKTDGVVTVDRSDVGGSTSSVYYVNDAASTEYAVTVCPAGATPPPPPPPATSPCSIRYFTLNPQSEIAGPLVDPGQYMVWTAQVIRSPNPPTTGLQWRSTGPYEFKAGHRYVVTMTDNTKTDGAVTVAYSDAGGSTTFVYYINDASSTEYAVTVCPATTPPPAGGGALAGAIDADNDGMIDDREIVDAIRLWISGATVPGAGQTIGDAEIVSLIQMWIMGEPVSASGAQYHPAPMVAHPLEVERALLLSTPARKGALTLDVVGTGVAGVELEVFDLSGRRVFQTQELGSRLRFDALDEVGRPLANGVYLYLVTARGADGSTWRSKIEKLAILR
ncbi:MAG TPA: PKD domain-containing protein [Candidatus Bipolaricaulota bacterium]